MLKPEYTKHFRGHIQSNTWGSHASSIPDGNFITVRVGVIDKVGNSSNEFVFRVMFQTGVLPTPKPPVPFDQEGLPKLGNVFIDLHNPYLMERVA